MHLRDGLGIRAFGKGACRQQVIAQHRLFLTAACLKEESLVRQVDVALLEVCLMVSMHGGYFVNSC